LKPQQLSQNRVTCPNCNQNDFCYSCLNIWKQDGLQICGNINCVTYEITQSLENCDVFHPNGLKVDVPLFRACPSCLTLICHVEGACKHMTCPRKDCGIEFCFSCLSIRDLTNIKYKLSSGWSCKGAFDDCEPAPRQILK